MFGKEVVGNKVWGSQMGQNHRSPKGQARQEEPSWFWGQERALEGFSSGMALPVF